MAALPSELMETKGVRVLVAEPHEVVRELIVDRLVASGFDVVAVAGDGQSTISLALQLQPDVVVIDVDVRDPDGVTAIKEMVRMDQRRRVVVLTATDDVLTARYTIGAGARGFVSKSEPFSALVSAIEAVMKGDTVVSPTVPTGFDRRSSRHSASLLSERETEVLRLVASGFTNTEISVRLFISARTVKNHLASIYDKLGAGDKTQALIRAVRLGIVEIL
jgi:two-component system, NarL family, response regulator DegU